MLHTWVFVLQPDHSSQYRQKRFGKLVIVLTPTAEAFLLLETSGRRFSLSDGQSWAIGRGDGCAVMLDSRSVSRLHALIQRKDGGDFSLVDLGSRNGSFVNARRVSLPLLLNDKDRVVFGDQELIFRNPAASNTLFAEAALTTRNMPTTSLHTHTLTTILVVDIRDFTPFARQVPESVLSQTIGTWFLKSGQITQRLGSWAQKYIGDAVMAVWVHDRPETMEAELLRALRAIIEINAATEEISRTLPAGPLRIGAGVNTGNSIVGGAEYTALGDTVNAAFRLEAATKQMGLPVALGERAFAELGVDAAAHFTRRGVELKGYDGESTAWGISFDSLVEFLRTRS